MRSDGGVSAHALTHTVFHRTAAARLGLVLAGMGVLTAGALCSVPFYPVPLTMQTLAVLVVGGLLGPRLGVCAVAGYLALGAAGAPVFHGGLGGPGVLAGPTGGYLIGFIFLALISGFFVDRFADKKWLHALGMFIGTIVLYIFGTAWLSFQSGMSFDQALTVGVIPFFPFDMIKILIAVMFGPIIKTRIEHFL